MKKYLFASLLGFAFVGIGVYAQENPPTGQPPANQPPVPSIESAPETGNIACFDYYQFGSVQADLQTDLEQTVPGATIAFSGKITNANDYPLVDGKLSVKIFKKDESTFAEGDGNPIVDQFVIQEDINLPAKGEKDTSFEWVVPNNARAGEYYAAYFFTTSNKYNLMGLSFTDDVVGNQAQFTITSESDPQSVTLSKAATTLNGQNHHFAAVPLHFKSDEVVTIQTTLVNPSAQEKSVPLQWNQYAWDSQDEANRRNTKTELVVLAPNETKTVSYEVKPQQEAVVYVTIITQDGESKSFLNVRYVRDGILETRINFPSLTKFPIKEGEPNRLFACAHSTNEPVVPGNLLILTLKDQNNAVIYQYRYEGDISGAMSGFGEEFLPKQSYDNVTLEAQLFRDGSEVENVKVHYDCNKIDPNSCLNKEEASTLSLFSGKTIVLVIGGLTLLALLVILYFIKRRSKTVTF